MKTYFISGHRDLTQQEFDEHYLDKIEAAIKEKAYFVVGDCPGADQMSIVKLKQLGYCFGTVYHIGNYPMIAVYPPFATKGMFASDYQRDFAMTVDSDEDIAWVRPGKERSGTANNLQRRMLLLQDKLNYETLVQLEADRFL